MPNANAITLISILSLGGCGLLELEPSSKITKIEPISIRVEVVELGPLNPERVAFPSDAPVTEVMPGDRVRIEVEVVDIDGLALADDRLDSVWLLLDQDTNDTPPLDPAFDVRCDELEVWTMDMPCRLGEGHGSIEFEAPPLGEDALWVQPLWVYAAIAWDGQSAETCWQARRARKDLPSSCDFLRAPIFVGPSWWLLAYAASQGIEIPLPVEHFHAGVFLQQANRSPVIEYVSFDHEERSGLFPPSDGVVGPLPVEPGGLVYLGVHVDETLQLSQHQFVPLNKKVDLFTLYPEALWMRVATAGPIRFIYDVPVPVGGFVEIEVDEDAEPGIARVLLAVVDDRGGESLVRVELEIQ